MLNWSQRPWHTLIPSRGSVQSLSKKRKRLVFVCSKKLFADLPEALSNTIEIAQKCHHRPKIKLPVLPTFHDDASQEKKLLRELSYNGLKKNLKQKFLNELK